MGSPSLSHLMTAILKPPMRAFGIAYISVVLPRVLAILINFYRKGLDVTTMLGSVSSSLSANPPPRNSNVSV
ncbi:MAG: hypothetical protein Q9207_003155 [Kuettlingeria erythrocarpa]